MATGHAARERCSRRTFRCRGVRPGAGCTGLPAVVVDGGKWCGLRPDDALRLAVCRPRCGPAGDGPARGDLAGWWWMGGSRSRHGSRRRSPGHRCGRGVKQARVDTGPGLNGAPWGDPGHQRGSRWPPMGTYLLAADTASIRSLRPHAGRSGGDGDRHRLSYPARTHRLARCATPGVCGPSTHDDLPPDSCTKPVT